MNIRNTFKIAMKVLTRIICPFQEQAPTQTKIHKIRAQAYAAKKLQRISLMRYKMGLPPKPAPRRTLIWPSACFA